MDPNVIFTDRCNMAEIVSILRKPYTVNQSSIFTGYGCIICSVIMVCEQKGIVVVQHKLWLCSLIRMTTQFIGNLVLKNFFYSGYTLHFKQRSEFVLFSKYHFYQKNTCKNMSQGYFKCYIYHSFIISVCYLHKNVQYYIGPVVKWLKYCWYMAINLSSPNIHVSIRMENL